MWQSLIPAALGAIGTALQGKKKPPAYQPPPPAATPRPTYQAPQYQAGPQYRGVDYNAPQYQAGPQYQGASYQGPQYKAGPQYQSQGAYQAPNTQFNPMQGELAKLLQGNLQNVQAGGSALPEEYRKSVLDRAKRSLGVQRDQDEARATENANKLGLLSSGTLGVRLGQMDQGYAREYSNLEDSLMQQDLGERNNLIQALMGIQSQQQPYESMRQQSSQFGYQAGQEEGQFGYGAQRDETNRAGDFDLEQALRQYTSQQANADKGYAASRDETNRLQDFNLEQALRQYTAQRSNADRGYDAARTETDRSNQFNMDNARQAFGSQIGSWDQQRSEQLGNAQALYRSQQDQFQAGQQQRQNLWGLAADAAQSGLQSQQDQKLLEYLMRASGGGGGNAVSRALPPWAGLLSRRG